MTDIPQSKQVTVDVVTLKVDGEPVETVVTYTDPETGEVRSFSGKEEHEAQALAKLDIFNRYGVMPKRVTL